MKEQSPTPPGKNKSRVEMRNLGAKQKKARNKRNNNTPTRYSPPPSAFFLRHRNRRSTRFTGRRGFAVNRCLDFSSRLSFKPSSSLKPALVRAPGACKREKKGCLDLAGRRRCTEATNDQPQCRIERIFSDKELRTPPNALLLLTSNSRCRIDPEHGM